MTQPLEHARPHVSLPPGIFDRAQAAHEAAFQRTLSQRTALQSTVAFAFHAGAAHSAATALRDFRDANHRHNDMAPGWCICGETWDDGEPCDHYVALNEAAHAYYPGAQTVADRAAAVYSASGNLVTVDSLPAELAEIADKAEGTYRQFRDAMRAGRDGDLDYPVAALSALLNVTAALNAALGYPDTPTALQVTMQMKAADVNTAAGDQVRLHLLAEHSQWENLPTSDREAAAEHDLLHRDDCGHPADDLSWSARRAEAVLDAIDVPSQQKAARELFTQYAARRFATPVAGKVAGDG